MTNINEYLEACIEEKASDLHLAVGKPPILRIDGSLRPINDTILKEEDLVRIAREITDESKRKEIEDNGGCDFGFSFDNIARFRASIFRTKGTIGISLRLIPSRLFTFEELGLSDKVRQLLHSPRGLILVTGPTGSGKTTTLATMTDYINSNMDAHIITIEDPIEYYHEHKKGIVTQREVGVDVPSFSEAIIKGLRSDPDVILVGEMRDLQTIKAALLAAETGHLVFATLHTISAAQTVDRIIDSFPVEEQEEVRVQLSTSILAVLSQQLLVRKSGKGRIAVFEIMVSTPSIQSLIRERKTFRITSELQTGAKYGMKPFDVSLAELYNKGIISKETVYEKAFDREQISSLLR
ncbi:MAG TPA: type IV pilus twitching motility protein PilT [Candidatus Omnitrophica bacterium]|nr:type IV pilus twitching motility protein PilT [Candidatus Omnitrophota bacterium]